jgi:hypothetical protein
MEIPHRERHLLIKNGYRQSVNIQKARVTRSSVESEKIRLKHLASGDIVSKKDTLQFILINLYFIFDSFYSTFRVNIQKEL